jgi:hypothetical protein
MKSKIPDRAEHRGFCFTEKNLAERSRYLFQEDFDRWGRPPITNPSPITQGEGSTIEKVNQSGCVTKTPGAPRREILVDSIGSRSNNLAVSKNSLDRLHLFVGDLSRRVTVGTQETSLVINNNMFNHFNLRFVGLGLAARGTAPGREHLRLADEPHSNVLFVPLPGASNSTSPLIETLKP